MSVSIVNGLTVTDFVRDRVAFNRCVDDMFKRLDVNGDGVLSRGEMRKGLRSFLESSPSSPCTREKEVGAIFEKFDGDRNGTVDRDEFRKEMREIMLAVANGIGDSPVQIAIENGSVLMRAVEHEFKKSQNN
ncbi:hypothetical protein QJS04_geneDACA017477 [Acorus gramineus]|uniref:EF-hand domain-containing protein n=1 Tax=Acorus gramineus TaxID=55184 RepID=A0AAV9AIM7_ACOGR|nr:hypothetical protein QJS04_geneDACA017477 [Acorus gramineus]